MIKIYNLRNSEKGSQHKDPNKVIIYLKENSKCQRRLPQTYLPNCEEVS